MRIIECEQGSPAWHAARCGRVTASRVADIVRKTKTGVSKMRLTYAGELVAERLAGTQPSDGFVSPAMQFGKDMEDEAAIAYAFMRDADVSKVGFVLHPVIDQAGASPDRMVGNDGILQIKVPNSSTHIESLLGADIDPDYVKQMQWELACTERAWCDFCSYDPRMPEHMRLHVQRIRRDNEYIAELETAVRGFLREVDERIESLTARYGDVRAAA